MNKLLFFLLFAVVFLPSCKNDESITYYKNNETEEETIDTTAFAKGADVGWLTEMESEDYLFYDSLGNESECMSLLKGLGMNSIRLRVWVNPTDGRCNKTDLLVKAKRANDLNMRIMIDFHYSDEWADPDDQHKPSGWEDLTLSELCDTVNSYTIDVLTSLKKWGITPEWVEIGNESTWGMLWNDDDLNADNSGYYTANNGANYTKLHNAGYEAAKTVFPNTKVVVCIHKGYNNSVTSSFLANVIGNDNDCEDMKVDVVGLTYYPGSLYETLDESCYENMQWIVENYNLDVMLCEVGMDYTEADACKAFLSDMIKKTKSVVDNDGNTRGLGVFYWEPEAYNGWESYTLGAFDDDGKPTVALDAFQN